METYNYKGKITINNPLKSITVGKKKYYLTANIFYGGVHFSVRTKIVNQVKMYLKTYFKKGMIPELEEMRIEISFWTKTTSWDIDNKPFFWTKIILDMLKGDCIHEDNVKYIPSAQYTYEGKGDKMEIRISGKTKS